MNAAAQRVAPGAQLGVTEEMIRDLVYAFYETVRRDPAIGPIFRRTIAPGEWPAHLAKLVDFWSSVLLMSGRFKGSPMTTHLALGELRPTHFARWLYLFGQTAQAVWPADAAALVIQKSELIARSLQLGIDTQRDRLRAVQSLAVVAQ